jgi:hypothetical protein
MPISIPEKPGQLFDNADSFAMVFDAAWTKLMGQPDAGSMSSEEKKRLALEACGDHAEQSGHGGSGGRFPHPFAGALSRSP